MILQPLQPAADRTRPAAPAGERMGDARPDAGEHHHRAGDGHRPAEDDGHGAAGIGAGALQAPEPVSAWRQALAMGMVRTAYGMFRLIVLPFALIGLLVRMRESAPRKRRVTRLDVYQPNDDAT